MPVHLLQAIITCGKGHNSAINTQSDVPAANTCLLSCLFIEKMLMGGVKRVASLSSKTIFRLSCSTLNTCLKLAHHHLQPWPHNESAAQPWQQMAAAYRWILKVMLLDISPDLLHHLHTLTNWFMAALDRLVLPDH